MLPITNTCHPTEVLLRTICVVLGRQHQTVYVWQELSDQLRWVFVPVEDCKPFWSVAMVDIVRTRCVNVDTLLGLLQPFVYSVIPTPAPECRQCGRTELEHFYTSKRDQTTLCPACFADREQRRVAKESRTPERQEEIALSSPPA